MDGWKHLSIYLSIPIYTWHAHVHLRGQIDHSTTYLRMQASLWNEMTSLFFFFFLFDMTWSLLMRCLSTLILFLVYFQGHT